jgi:hypothetical protein
MMAFSFGKVRVTAGKESEGLFARGSKCGMNLIEATGLPPALAASVVSALELRGPLWLRIVSTAPAVSARLLVIGRAGVDSAVVTVGAGRDDGASSEVDCWRIRARLVPSLVFPLGTHPFVCVLAAAADGGLGARL